MNRTKIEWTDYTWNPITGCTKLCDYCYARTIAKRFPNNYDPNFFPVFYPERLREPLNIRKPSKIFTCSMGDFFDKYVKRKWQDYVLGVIEDNPKHIFQILTKVPQNIPENMIFPENLWLGVTVEQIKYIDRAEILMKLEKDISVRFVSYEPLLEDVGFLFWTHIYSIFTDIPLRGVGAFDWVIIGGLSGKKSFKPPKEWVDNIIYSARGFHSPVFVKNNAGYPIKVQEFPK